MWISKKKFDAKILEIKTEAFFSNKKNNDEIAQWERIEKLEKQIKKLKKQVKEGY